MMSVEVELLGRTHDRRKLQRHLQVHLGTWVAFTPNLSNMQGKLRLIAYSTNCSSGKKIKDTIMIKT
jgi:hypothetical protein